VDRRIGELWRELLLLMLFVAMGTIVIVGGVMGKVGTESGGVWIATDVLSSLKILLFEITFSILLCR
jgi:hypothetical protein